MAILLGLMDKETKQEFESEKQDIQRAKRTELQLMKSDLNERLVKTRTEFGAKLPIGEFTKIVDRVSIRDDLVLLARVHLLISYFENYPALRQRLQSGRYPPHAQIELDHRGEFPPRPQLEIHIPEAMLFEDMCYFFNEVWASSGRPQPLGYSIEDKKAIKEMAAVKRGTVLSAFHMVEAFANGISYEVQLTKLSELSEKERILITEWDHKRRTQRFVNLRDKLLKYPRLLIGSPHPILDESSCPELKYFLTEVKSLRDAIVHQNPSVAHPLVANKGRLFSEIGLEDCEKVVDNAVALIEKISEGLGKRKPFWLQKRTQDGPFDDSVFS